ncbi:MAG: hypothetical protein MUC29_01795 [Pyrinomonadaceae bacterium]|jgi:Tfp pilus assembly protein PilN|nr:hypothetical protein [Pyrinomonadaceae bacterium]
MIENLNLSSRPFRNRTLPWLLSAFLLGCSLIGLLYFMADWRKSTSEDEIAKSDLAEIEAKVQKLKEQGEKVQQQLTPQQKSLLIASHKLVAKKNFRWSYLLSDLERVLPTSVSVSRINVENIYKGKAEIDFAVLSKDYQSVINMIDTMNSGGTFQAELRGQDLQKGDTIIYSEYTIRLIYNSPNGVSNEKADENTVAAKTEEQR